MLQTLTFTKCRLRSQVIVVNESKEENDLTSLKKSNLLITLKEDGFADLPRILKLVQASKGYIEHIESRRNETNRGRFDVFLSLMIASQSLLSLMRAVRQGNLGEITVLREKLISVKGKCDFVVKNVILTNQKTKTLGFHDTSAILTFALI